MTGLLTLQLLLKSNLGVYNHSNVSVCNERHSGVESTVGVVRECVLGNFITFVVSFIL